MSYSKRDRIDQTKLAVFTRAGWRCCHIDKNGHRCTASATECAHIIGQGHASSVKTLWNSLFKEQRSYTWIDVNVMNNPLNMAASCRSHNDYFNIGFKPETVKAKLQEIYDAING